MANLKTTIAALEKKLKEVTAERDLAVTERAATEKMAENAEKFRRALEEKLEALKNAPAPVASSLSLETLVAQFMEAKDSGVVKALHAFMHSLVENYHDGPGAPGRAAFQLFEAFANPNDELYKGLSVMERQGATTMASSLKQAFRVG